MEKQYGAALINDGWSFRKIPFGTGKEEAQENGKWQDVDLPHDWLIWQAENLYESAEVRYRREITREEAEAPVTLVRFDGVYMDCDVLFNGERICSHAYGYTAFDAFLTGKIRPGKNLLEVHIRHRSPNTRWYSGSGIFRNVHLIRLPAAHLVPDGLYVTPRRDGKNWNIRISAETVGEGIFSCNLTDAEGRTVCAGETKAEEGRACLSLPVTEGRLWSTEDPYLYTLHYAFGDQRDCMRIGLRETRFDPQTGFWLNGKNIKMHGVCLHHDLGALGAAFHPKAARRQLRVMKEMGVNALRTSHNPPAREMLDLCDEMGILVNDEAFDMWEGSKTEYDYARFFPDHEAEDVASWVRRDRNHACVIMWSIGNEIYDMHAGPRGAEVTRMLTEQVRLHDPERNAEVTFGCNYMPWEGGQRCADIVKIPGYNYGEKLYEAHHAAHPDWVIYGSETASLLSSRGVYHFPADRSILSDVDLQCSSLGNSATSWGTPDLGLCAVEDLKNPYSMGQFLWSGIDYIGEPTPYHTRSCYFGMADTACFPKDGYYVFQSLWTDRKMIHIGVSWDWNPGQMIDIRVMTNCPEAELTLNGESLGRKRTDPRDPVNCIARWRVPFAAGELAAVGYDEEGREICRDVRRTSGDTAALRARAEDEALRGDGEDITFIDVSGEDSLGRSVDNARDRITVRVSGGARLLGMDNGDPTDPDGYKVSSKRMFNGRLLVIIGSTGEKEDARVEMVSGTGLRTELVIPVIPSERKKGTSALLRIPQEDMNRKENPVRRLIISAEGSTALTKENPETAFSWRLMPEDAQVSGITWQVTNYAGIQVPGLEIREEKGRISVRGRGDGDYYLRALYGNAPDHPELISQMEITVSGLGKAGLNPYEFVSAGLYDFSAGEVGAGNEQGIAFARDEWSMVGFRNVEFGAVGSDRLTLPIFTLNGEKYDIEMYLGDPREGGRLLTKLPYEKPSVWNTYIGESWRLPEILRGTQTICFALDRKIHVKGFLFEKQSRAFREQKAAEADSIYGDSFTRQGGAVTDIGNNVSLIWENMDFGERKEAKLILAGRTPLPANAITLRMENGEGETLTELVTFRGTETGEQVFPVKVPGGVCRVSFVFLPGSRFDFHRFRFA